MRRGCPRSRAARVASAVRADGIMSASEVRVSTLGTGSFGGGSQARIQDWNHTELNEEAVFAQLLNQHCCWTCWSCYRFLGQLDICADELVSSTLHLAAMKRSATMID